MLSRVVMCLLVAGRLFGPPEGGWPQEPVRPVRATASDAGNEPRVPRIPRKLPFKTGEVLVYDVSFSKLIFSGQIGQLKLWVSEPQDNQDPELIEFKAEAISKGFFTWLFGIKVKDQFKALVRAADLGLHISTKTLEEGKARVEQKAVIDREARRVVYTERDLVNKKSHPKVKEAESPPWVQDFLSAIYLVRTQHLKEGESIVVPISDAGKVYNVEVVGGKLSEIKVGAGKFKAVEAEVKIFDGRFINKKGQLIVWFSDDERRLPVKARVKTSGATVTIQLVSTR
jgi:hypothetical protein